jgi:hypothetical protein
MDGELFGLGNRLSERKRGRNFTKGAFGEFSLSRLVASLLSTLSGEDGWVMDGDYAQEQRRERSQPRMAEPHRP